MSVKVQGYRLLPMLADQLDRVKHNERRAYSHPWTEGIFKDCINSGYECWLIEVADEVIGHGILSTGAGESHLLNICINPEYQGLGYGALLLNHMVARAEFHECRCVFLEVRASNLAAYKLYEKSGFTEIGVRKDYYPGYIDAEDALVLTKELLQTPAGDAPPG
ncbi:MAG: ribosomal-protein-alanine N-acetyltransferase [Candidatus Azotimanducaceae bacterium]|jgi:ribosomal-protein-alanine N-acetyltransferase